MSVSQAIAKINAEIQEKNNPYVQVVGNFLKEYLEIDNEAATNILNGDKSIMESIKAMREAARENQVDGVGMLTDAEGFEVVLRYYDIEPVDPEEVQREEVQEFDVSLDDFL